MSQSNPPTPDPTAGQGDRSTHPFDSMPTGKLGMVVFLVSLGALFAATMLGYLVIMVQQSSQREVQDLTDTAQFVSVAPVELPPLPILLLASTAVIILSSGTVQLAKSSIRRGNPNGLRAWMLFTLVLGVAFLAIQTVCWLQWYNEVVRPLTENHSRFAAFGFLTLSGIHAAHVLGGIVPMLVVLVRAFRGRYSATRYNGVSHIAAYWHFLDVVWIIMYATLFFFTR